MQLIQMTLGLLIATMAGSKAMVSAPGNAQQVTIRTAVSDEAKILTSTINDAYADYTQFNRSGSRRCNPDGSQGVRKQNQ